MPKASLIVTSGYSCLAESWQEVQDPYAVYAIKVKFAQVGLAEAPSGAGSVLR
jgi:hypothetical protein